MLKIVKSIVNTNRSLIGFVIEGKEREFGGMTNNPVQNVITIQEMARRKFSNNQLAVVNNKLIEKNSFKINQLPMIMYNNNNYMDIDNKMNIIKRYVQDNENIGFRVAFTDGVECDFKYEQVLMLAKWFKPNNFMIRTSSTNKEFISGKPGSIKLNELPMAVIGETTNAKRTKSGAKEKTQTISGGLVNGFDIIDIYNFIDSCDGCVIKLPSEKYIGKDPELSKADEDAGFIPLGIGEVANAKPIYNATKLSVNANFKKVGRVNVNINGQEIGITTFVHRTKSIFLNGENNIKKFGIAVPVSKESELVRELGRSLALTKITDEMFTKPLSQVINVKDLVFYTVDTSHIDLISDKKKELSIMSASKLSELIKKRFELNLLTKLCSPKTGLIKKIKDEMGTDFVAEVNDRKPFGAFVMMSKEYLKMLEDAGIDVYTGAFDVSKAVGGMSKYSSKKSSGADNDEVSIEYNLYGYDASKISFSMIVKAAEDNDNSKVPDSVLHLAQSLLAITDKKEQLKKAQEIYADAEKKFAQTTQMLWMHNASMYMIGNKAKIHTHDTKKWAVDTKSRVKNAVVYASTEIPGLTVRFNGVTI